MKHTDFIVRPLCIVLTDPCCMCIGGPLGELVQWSDIISALYSQNPYMDVETVITYQDGRTATLQTRLKIENLDGPG